jgi:hypothetical protein
MYEHRSAPVLPWKKFLIRLAISAAISLGLVGGSLGIGMLGYHAFEHMSWLDAYANASMILSGMGPLASPQTRAGKLFAGSYALFSGLVFVSALGIILAPLLHRFLHKFHMPELEGKKSSAKREKAE